MTWTKLSDDFTDQPKLLEVSRSARFLLVEMLVWSNKHLTDGHISNAAMRRATDSLDPEVDAKELIAADQIVAVDDGYQVLNWTKHQESAAKVEHRQRLNAERKERWKAKRSHASGDHGDCDPSSCDQGTHSGTRSETRPRTDVGTVPLPNPSRPEGRAGRGSSEQTPVAPHGYVDDGGGHDDCETCQLPKRHPAHGRSSR